MSAQRRIISVLVLTGAALAAASQTAMTAGTDVTTYHNDNARTGQNLNENMLTPGNVRVSTFGKVGFFSVDGKVDAQSLYLSGLSIPGQGAHNVLYLATEHDSVYAFDADTGGIIWRVSVLGTGESPSDGRSCSQVVPEIGITATPVIDRARGVIYVVGMSRTAGGAYVQRLHALDITTGAEMLGGPRTIQATFPGTGAGSSGGTVVFDPKQYEERSALLLLNGSLITSWTSHCDIDPYTGWIMSYDAATLSQTSVLNVTPNGSRGAFWMAGAGPAADPSGNVYALSGNGTFDVTLDGSGFPINRNFGNAFLKVSTSSGLSVADYFETFNTVSQSNADTDLGSGGVLVLPDFIDGSGQTRHLAVGAGKDSHMYVVNRDQMGKWNPSSNSQIYQDIAGALSGGVFAMPAYFNNTLYYGAVGDGVKAFPITNARIASVASSRTARSFAYPGATPSISAMGAVNGIVWAVENVNPAVLHAYDARDLTQELYNSSQAAGGRDTVGTNNKFITPTIVNGHVYVGTANGVAVFGLLSQPPIAPRNLRILQ
jgi:hypothetical protein